MTNLNWLFGWAENNDIEIPKDSKGKTDVDKLFEIYKEQTGGARDYPINTSYTEILSKDKKESLNSPNPPQNVYGFENKKKKNSPDHLRHAQEMGFKNQDEYEREAANFWDKGNGEVFYGSKRGRFVKYNEKTGEYIVVDKDGTLRTYYKLNIRQFNKKIKQEDYRKWKK